MNNNNDEVTLTMSKTHARYIAMLIDSLTSEYMGIKSLNEVEDPRNLSYHKDSGDAIAEPTDIAVLKELVDNLSGRIEEE